MSLLGAIDRSAATGRLAVVEGMECADDAADLVADGLATLSAGFNGCAVLAGHDPEDRPFTVALCDVYAHELEDQ